MIHDGELHRFACVRVLVKKEVPMETLIGKVTHYYNRISVAVVDLSTELNIGDTILFLGHTTDFTQEVTSLEIEHQKVHSAGPGGEVAVKVDGEVRHGDLVYKVQAE